MATFTGFIAKLPTTGVPPQSSAAGVPVFFSNPKPFYPVLTLRRKPLKRNKQWRTLSITKASAASSGVKGSPAPARDEKVKKVHSAEEFDEALREAKNKLVVVEYAESDSDQSNKMYPFLVDLSRTCNDVVFLLVMGDESDKTRELCRRENIDKVPHFSFYKSMEKIHEEEGILFPILEDGLIL